MPLPRPNKGRNWEEEVVIIFVKITMPLATFLSCMHFSYELLDFIGMATRESRHAYFCFLQTPQNYSLIDSHNRQAAVFVINPYHKWNCRCRLF